jgi:eukaryotic-like serine/threonine-protein kinase
MKGLARDPLHRWATAKQMAHALEQAVPPASTQEISAWLRSVVGDRLTSRAKMIADFEADTETPSVDVATRSEAPTVVTHDAPRSLTTTTKRRALPFVVGIASSAIVMAIVLVAYRWLGSSEKPIVLQNVATSKWQMPTGEPVVATPSSASMPSALTKPPTVDGTARPPLRGPDKGVAPNLPRPEKDCDVPFYIQDGVKKWKPECL